MLAAVQVEERIRALGFSEEDTRTLADHFLDAERRGKRGHGFARVEWLETLTGLDPAAEPECVVAEACYERWDGRGALLKSAQKPRRIINAFLRLSAVTKWSTAEPVSGTAEAHLTPKSPWQPCKFRRKIRVCGLRQRNAIAARDGFSTGKARQPVEN